MRLPAINLRNHNVCVDAAINGARQEFCPMRQITAFFIDDAGATAVEYALLCSLIALALVVILGQIGTQLSAEFSEVSSALK